MAELTAQEQAVVDHAARQRALEAKIARMEYYDSPIGGIICVLTLLSGFRVEGRTRCSDETDGQGLAYTDALNKMWEMELYLAADAAWSASVGGNG